MSAKQKKTIYKLILSIPTLVNNNFQTLYIMETTLHKPIILLYIFRIITTYNIYAFKNLLLIINHTWLS
jgi:hypothetical protein